MSEKKGEFDNRPIGIFDSGLGGLTVVAALRRRLPGESIVYLGDTARVPYGDKSVEAIIRFAREDVAFMRSRGVKMIVAACNTVSAVAMDALRSDHLAEPLLGVIDSGVRAAVAAGARRIAVIGTRATVNSDAYRRGIHAADCSIKVESIPCPLLVPLVEEGIVDGPLVEMALDRYLSHLKSAPPEALLLGCTHYPLLKEAVVRYFDGQTQVIDSAGACAAAVADFLREHRMAAQEDNCAVHGYFVTDMPAAFGRHAARFLGEVPERVEQILLG